MSMNSSAFRSQHGTIMDPVDPAARLELDPERLARFPEGYRHLAYLQSLIGYPVKTDMPGLTGPEVEALYARSRAWLAGEALSSEAKRGQFRGVSA